MFLMHFPLSRSKCTGSHQLPML
uniref:Uncharacterized protein n=1 Tax=Arundo donax TaxID=35708 RepID=A0A0A9C9H9_ARUDO